MGVEKIPDVGDDALAAGFLNKKYGQSVVNLVNLLRLMEVQLADGMGMGKFEVSREKIVLNLTQLFNGTTVNFQAWLGGILVVYAIPAKYVGPAPP